MGLFRLPVAVAKMNKLVAAVILGLVCFVSSSDDESARLLAAKSILNEMLVEGKDLSVQYTIFNVGGSAALDVELSDAGFPKTDFDVVRGNLNVKWPRIAPGSNVSHVVIVKPTKSGYFNFTSGEIKYRASEESQNVLFGYTSAPGEGGIVNFRDYDRKFSPHIVDWGAFAIMTLPCLGIPYLLWKNSASKYSSDKSKK